jgi:hypothetical protein
MVFTRRREDAKMAFTRRRGDAESYLSRASGPSTRPRAKYRAQVIWADAAKQATLSAPPRLRANKNLRVFASSREKTSSPKAAA